MTYSADSVLERANRAGIPDSAPVLRPLERTRADPGSVRRVKTGMQGPGPHPGMGSGWDRTGAPARSAGRCRLPAEPRIVAGFRSRAAARTAAARLRHERACSSAKRAGSRTASAILRDQGDDPQSPGAAGRHASCAGGRAASRRDASPAPNRQPAWSGHAEMPLAFTGEPRSDPLPVSSRTVDPLPGVTCSSARSRALCTGGLISKAHGLHQLEPEISKVRLARQSCRPLSPPAATAGSTLRAPRRLIRRVPPGPGPGGALR